MAAWHGIRLWETLSTRYDGVGRNERTLKEQGMPRERLTNLSSVNQRTRAREGAETPATTEIDGVRQDGNRLDQATSGEIEGKVAGPAGNAITGWVWDPARPYEPLEIEIYVGNAKVGHGRADLFDLELAKAKLGNGMHRFELGLERLPLGQPPYVLRFVVADSEIELGPSITLSTLEDAERLLAGSEYHGRVTGLADGMICGWVVNRRNSHERPMLSLRDGDRTLVTQIAGELASESVQAGVTANVYRFELPLPAGLVDGRLHRLSVTVGEPGAVIEGSPVLFGPTDITSLGRELTNFAERLQKIDRRVEALGPSADAAALQNQIATRVLDRVDALLNVHRDSIERELAVIRRQLTRIMQQVPDLEPDVIVSLHEAATIEDETVPDPATFGRPSRVVPLLSFDLSVPTPAAILSAGLQWSDSGTGVLVTGNGTMELGDAVAAPASLIIGGDGARDPFEFCGLLTTLDGYPISGRVNVFDTDRWNYTGTTINGSIAPERGLRFTFLDGHTPSRNPLTIDNVAVYGHGRAPFQPEETEPQASIVYVGIERFGTGWYAVEAGGRGGLCWMGPQSETTFRLKPSHSYVFSIPELRPLIPDILTRLEISIGGVPATFKIAPLTDDGAAFSIEGRCQMPEEAAADLVFRISFPSESVHSPMELGLNNDARPLTIAVRAIGLRIGR
jgi:hypothetical protein